MFRSARSLNRTFSTVINFGVLGFFRRLNCLQIQIKLENECDLTKIRYPRAEAHRKKDGHSKSNCSGCNINLITTEGISSSVQEALTMAKQTIEDLGMAKLLQSKSNWDYPPIPGVGLDVCKEDDADDSEDMEEFSFLQERTDLEVPAQDVKTEIAQLSEAKIIDDELKDQLDWCTRSASKESVMLDCPFMKWILM